MVPVRPLGSHPAERWSTPPEARFRFAEPAAAPLPTRRVAPSGELRSQAPIVVDLDGTLVATDTLAESVLAMVKAAPARLLWAPLWLASGRARFKAEVAGRGAIAVSTLPYNQELLEFLHAEKCRGRRIVLATAAHESIARQVAEHLGLFDRVIATSGDDNLKGERKLAAIEAELGQSFAYIGDHAADLPIWRRAEQPMLVERRPGAGARLQRQVTFTQVFAGEGHGLGDWIRAFRVHQWLKNLLLLVPLLTSFQFLEPGKLLAVLGAFLAFSVAASATYVMNDLLDLGSDRIHPRKRNRPFASGRIGVVPGAAAASAMLALALAAAPLIAPKFACMLVVYLVATVTYSLVLKRYVLIDVMTLGLLYTLRIIAGATAISVAVSPWLLAFSMFLFTSLAMVKRCSELVSLGAAGRSGASGRDYQVTDLTVLWPLGVGTALCAVVVFGLFINVPDTQARYATPELLWCVALGLIYWLGRLWTKTSRGEMHDDPILFAARDRGSRVVIAAMVLATVAAHWLALGEIV